MSFFKPSARDAISALKGLEKVEVPEGGDVDGDALNSPGVLRKLSPEDRQLVLDYTGILYDYLRKDGQNGPEENRRGINAINRTGLYHASLNSAQYDQSQLVGRVGNGDFHVDISDPNIEEESE
jgi:hypothetical protein